MVDLHHSEAFDQIEQHVYLTRLVVQDLASSNSTRVQEIYKQFTDSIRAIYKAGEGWIEKDVHHILDAVEFAAKKHQMQVRKDRTQTSYLVHPLFVAHHLINVGKVRNPDIIIAGLLHDTLEDTDTLYQELIEHFGKQVADFVQEVSDDKTLPKGERKRLQVVTAQHKSAGAAQIKLADKWDNLRDNMQNPPVDWESHTVAAYFKWAQQVIEGLPWVNAPLLQSVRQVIEEFYKSKSS